MKFFISDKRAVGILLATLGGLVVAVIILRIAELPSKYIFGVLLVIPFSFAFTGDIKKFMLAVFLFLVPFSLNIAPFHLDPSHPPPFHFGGAQAQIQIWVSQLPFVVLLFLWGVEIARRKKKIQFTPIDIPALLFIGWNVFSLLNTTRLDLSLSHLFRLLMFYLVYLYTVNNLRDIKSLQFAVKILLAGFLFEALLSYGQYWFDLPFHMGSGGIELTGTLPQMLETGQVVSRVHGTLGWPNTFGTYIAMMLPLSFSMFLASPLMRSKLSFVSFVFGFVALMLTFSRGAWIGALASLLLVTFLFICARQFRAKKVFFLAFVVPLLIPFVIISLGEPIYLRLTATPAAVSLDRIKLMQVAWEMIKAHPFLGVGLNTFTEVMQHYDTTGISGYFPRPVHNYFLLVAAETGMFGSILFMALLATSARIATTSISKAQSDTVALRIGFTAALLSGSLANLVDATLRFYTTGLLFWILMGLIGACWVNREHMPLPRYIS